MHRRPASTTLLALAALSSPCRCPAQDPGELLERTQHSLQAAATAGLAAAKTGTLVHVELEQDGPRLVFSIDVAKGRRSVNVVLDATTLALIGNDAEEADHRRIVGAAKVPLVQAIAAAEQAISGRAVEAELVWQQEQPVFKVRMWTTRDQVVFVDAISGKVQGAPPDAPPPPPPLPATGEEPRFTDTFPLLPGELVSRGTNPFFVLEPGFTLTLAGSDAGEVVEVTITVLDTTRVVGGVETRIVEERETKGGQLAEVSRNFFAISQRTSSVYYFGEEVDIYRGGTIVSHDGAWLAGQNGARFGLLMPGTPLLGSRYHQEIAPKVAMDRAEIVALDVVVTCAAGTFHNCMQTIETTPLEPGDRSPKVYAPGIGLVSDGPLRLVRHGSGR